MALASPTQCTLALKNRPKQGKENVSCELTAWKYAGSINRWVAATEVDFFHVIVNISHHYSRDLHHPPISSSSSSSSSRSSLNVFWKVFAEVGYKWLGNLTDCKGGSQDNKAHSHMMMLIIMLTIAMFVMIHHVQAQNSKSNHLVPTTWQVTSGVLPIATCHVTEKEWCWWNYLGLQERAGSLFKICTSYFRPQAQENE